MKKLEQNKISTKNISKFLIDDYGDLVLFDIQNKSIWKSNTRSLPGVYNVSLCDTGNITIFNNKNKSLIYNVNWINYNFETEIDDPKNLKLIVPLDFYPNFEDSQWNRVALAAQKIKILAIIQGKYERPVDVPNVNYERAIRKLKNAGVDIFGHVNVRNINQIKKDIKTYLSWDAQIRPTGIFLKGQIENLKELHEYVDKNFGKEIKVISQQGINSKNLNNLNIEHYTGRLEEDKIALIRNLNKKNDEIEKLINDLQKENIRYIYLTDKSSFDILPSYFDKEIEILASKQRKISKF